MQKTTAFDLLKALHYVSRRAKGHDYVCLYEVNSLNTILECWERFVMAKPNASKRAPFDPNKFKFVNRRLTVKEREHFHGWYQEHSSAFEDLLQSLLVSGIKFSCSWDYEHECYISSFTCVAERDQNTNKVMTSRSDDWLSAIMMNVYKHMVIFGEGVWEIDDEGTQMG